MDEFKQRQKFKRILYSRFTLVVLVIICLILAKATYGIFQKYEISKTNQAQLQAQLTDLQSRKAFVDSAVQSLETPEGVSYELQDKFGVVEPGEHEIVIVDATTTDASSPDSGGFFDNVVDFFTHW